MRLKCLPKLQQHAEIISDVHDIDIVWTTKRMEGMGYSDVDNRRIIVPPIKSSKTYALFLHECGHILGPYQYSPYVRAEACAWEWAKDNALIWTKAMNMFMKECLATYRPPNTHQIVRPAWWPKYSKIMACTRTWGIRSK